jgi:hypothetical protein
MFNARNSIPLTTAVAAGMAVCARGSLKIEWLPGMAHRPASLPAMFPDRRGISR